MTTKMKFFAAGIALALAMAVGVVFYEKQHTAEKHAEGSGLMGRVAGRFDQEYRMTKDPATQKVPRNLLLEAYKIANQKRAIMAQQEDQLPIYWYERGPNNVGGRTRAILYDRNDPTNQTVWAAAVAGGLWRSGNITAANPSWALVNDFFPNLAITTIVQNPANPQIMYFGTGEEGNNNADAVRGLGIWRSMDGGANWARLALNVNAVNQMEVAADGTVYVAASNGLHRSTTNGNTFTVIRADGQNVQDVEIAADGDVYIAVNSVGIQRLSGGTWANLSTDLPNSGFRRIELACAPSNANTLYAMYQNSTDNTCLTIRQSTNGGDNWTIRTVPNLGTFLWYATALEVDPANAARVWAGNQNLFVSGDNGTAWAQIANIHADHHVVTYRPGSSSEVLLGNDGGVYRATNADAALPTVGERNAGYNVTQFYANAIHPTAGINYNLGGTQDNGTQRLQVAGLGASDEPTGADGSYCFIDQDNPLIQITGSQNRVFYRSITGGAAFPLLLGTNNNALFITPAGYDSDENVFYYSNGNGEYGRITNIGLVENNSLQAVAQLSGRASAFCISPNTTNRVFIGSENGSVVRVDDAHDAATFTDITPSPSPGGYVSCIATEPGNDNHLLLTYSNYSINSVWESTNGGTDWTSIEGDLPNMPVRWAMFHPFNPDQVMLATELGVWSTDDLNGTTTQWWPTNNFGLANVRVDMLQYRASDHLVVAATHGRGMYSTDYFTLLDNCPLVVSTPAGNIPSGIYMAEDMVFSDGVITPGRKVILHAGESVLLQPGFHAQNGSDMWALILACGTGVPKPANIVESSNERQSTIRTIGTGIEMRCSPNPTNFLMRVQCHFEAPGTAQLCIRSIEGHLVQTLANNQALLAGNHTFTVDATTLPAGIYLVTLQTNIGAVTERFIVAK